MNARPWLIGLVSLIVIVAAVLGVRRLWRRSVREANAERAQLTALATQLTEAAHAPEALPTAPAGAQPATVATAAGAAGHPRLYFTAAELAGLRSQARASHRAIWQPLQAYARSLAGAAPRLTGASRNNLDFFRDSADQLITLAFVCAIAEASQDCDLARTYLLTFAAWDQWGENNERGLGLSHMLQANALAYDWLHDRLTPAERQRVSASLAGWAQQMYEASAATEVVARWNNWWRASYVQNHYFIANSALGLAGLALLGEDTRAQTWVDQANARLTRGRDLLNGIGDGSWHEGMSYQAYLLSSALPFWTNLRRLQGIDLFPHDYLQQYTTWRVYNSLPGSTQFLMAFGDFEWSYLGPRSPLPLRFNAAEYQDGHAEWLAQQLLAAGERDTGARSYAWQVFEFLAYDPSVRAAPPTDSAPAQVFPDLEGVIWRSGWDANALVFGLKSGPYAGRFAFDTFVEQAYPWDNPCTRTGCQLNTGHDHADAGTFYLYGGGAWLAPEAVAYANNVTTAHNTLLIDGQGQYWPRQAERRDPKYLTGTGAFLEATANTAHFSYVAANVTGPYRRVRGLTGFTRHVVFVRPGYLLLLDSLAAASAHQYEWVSHFGQNVAVEGNWVRGEAAGGQVLGIGVVAPQPFRAVTGNDGAPYVRLRPATRAADVRFITLLYPTQAAAWNARPSLTLLADTGQAAAIRVQLNDGSGRTDDILVTYAAPGTPVTVGPYRYDGRVAVVQRGPAGQPAGLFVYGATFLQDQANNQMLAEQLDPAEPLDTVTNR